MTTSYAYDFENPSELNFSFSLLNILRTYIRCGKNPNLIFIYYKNHFQTTQGTMVIDQKCLEEEPPKGTNKITALQWERLKLWESDSPERRDQVDILGFLEAEINIQELAQVEIGWKERLMDLHNRSDTFGSKRKYASEIKKIEKEILKLGKESWFAERIWWSKRATFYEGPLTYGIDLWRSHPAWYMHQVLVQDCAGKGGCCGRGCNCCAERRGKLPGRKFGEGVIVRFFVIVVRRRGDLRLLRMILGTWMNCTVWIMMLIMEELCWLLCLGFTWTITMTAPLTLLKTRHYRRIRLLTYHAMYEIWKGLRVEIKTKH